VFPWILSDYTSAHLALEDERVYRDLSKPMGALGADRAQLFSSRYANWEDPSGVVPPFHYGQGDRKTTGQRHSMLLAS